MQHTELLCADYRIEARKGAVVAAGAWSGDLLTHSLQDDRWQRVFKPRRGHLLEVQPPPAMPPLQHGLMELGYTQVCTCLSVLVVVLSFVSLTRLLPP